jgi:5-methylcytosine-specific restriction protein B
MFLNQLVNLASVSSRSDDLEVVLRNAIAPPPNDDGCRASMNAFADLVDDLRAAAEDHGKAKPAPGHVPYVLSFFWEAQDRERWPIYYRVSRKVLQQYGLFSSSDNVVDSYLEFRQAIQDLKLRLAGDTWQIEALLWVIGQPPPVIDDPPPEPKSVRDVYSAFAGQGLSFSDELVTSFVLSLRSKPFVILSGISGTGKTKLAQGLAHYFESTEPAVPALAVRESDENNIYIRLTDAIIRMARARLRNDQQDAFEMPDRGTSARFSVEFANGPTSEIRINNVGFSAVDRDLVLLSFTGAARRWLPEAGHVGDDLHLRFDGDTVRGEIIPATGQAATDGGVRHALIPVKADWTDPRGLIGFFNPITQEYDRTPLIDLILSAQLSPDRPYFVILDEMNLARVEYYFSDFLSAMESDESISLISGADGEEPSGVPASVSIPKNVFFVGTVNIDETTHAFSPKVLDRANVIEFNDVDVDAVLSETPTATAGTPFRLKEPSLSSSEFARPASNAEKESVKSLAREEPLVFGQRLKDIHSMLERHHLHFGYRVINEVMLFVGHAIDKVEGKSEDVATTAFDLATLQKILPKLNGGRELEEPLTRLLSYCLGEEPSKDAPISSDVLRRFDDFGDRRRRGEDVADVPMPRSATKLARMLRRLRTTGFTSYLE